MENKLKNQQTRLPNFTAAEESLLITLAEQHANILENKRTDAVGSEEKKKVWDQINRAFEAQIGIKRGPKNLKEKYENLKRKTRKSLAGERRELYKTGGGRNQSYVDPNTERVAALLGQSATGFNNHYDSDVITYAIEKMDKEDTTEVLDEASEVFEVSMRSLDVDPEVEAVEALENTTGTDWSSWNPTQLKKKTSEKLAVRREVKKQSDRQQQFWEDENKRAAERHQWTPWRMRA